MNKLTIGRIVHFVFDSHGELVERPAIVVSIWSNECCNLQVFTDGTNDHDSGTPTRWETSISYSEAPRDHSWHWPEKE